MMSNYYYYYYYYDNTDEDDDDEDEKEGNHQHIQFHLQSLHILHVFMLIVNDIYSTPYYTGGRSAATTEPSLRYFLLIPRRPSCARYICFSFSGKGTIPFL